MNKGRILFSVLILAVLAGSTWYVAKNDLIGKFFNEVILTVGGARIRHEDYLKMRMSTWTTSRFDTDRLEFVQKTRRQ